MDIVDVDEALKDDSFIFLEDKTHDDISNILQQWKSSNCILSSNNTSHLPQQQKEQAHKYDSRTFTRPKRKSAQNLEQQFTNNPQYQPNNQQQQNQPDNPMLNLEIGGLVTNMHKSFLQNSSPPPFSSMDVPMDQMSNSLISSADFTNINFLQSTNSLDFGDQNAVGITHFNLSGKVTSDGYTLSDMIRDRKALESLTMSSDGALIKDSHIAQIDDISLTLSKTASGCSTMDNSTESVEVNNRTVEMINRNMDQSFNVGVQLELAACSGLKAAINNISGNGGQIPNALQRTMVLSDEMIGDITYNLVENSMYASVHSEQALSVSKNFGVTQNPTNDNLLKPTITLDETICLSGGDPGDSQSSNIKTENTTFSYQNVTPDMRCETPEGAEKNASAIKYYESTPISSRVPCNKHHYTPTLKMIYDGNVSPIVSAEVKSPPKATRILNETFESDQQNLNKTDNVNCANTSSGKLSLMTTFEMIDNIENPISEKTFNMEQQSTASLEMKNVMDLAEAEANILASNNNEEEFDHILDEFSKVELNEEQLKIRKSLDSIKKRFSYGPNKDKLQQKEISREAKDMRDMIRASVNILGENDRVSKDYLNMTVDVVTQHSDDLKKPDEHLIESPHALSEALSDVTRSPFKDSVTTSSISDSKISNGLSLSSVSTASNGGERLLNRRSRLYDDFNISTLSSTSTHGTKTFLGSSFTVHKEDDVIGDNLANVKHETENKNSQNPLEMVKEKTEIASEGLSSIQALDNSKEFTSISQYKLAEKRERDRDRFKTIKIIKNRNEDESCGDGPSRSELNVPCIDDYPFNKNGENAQDCNQQNQRFSRRDQTVSPVFNNNKSEVETNIANKTTSKTNLNFLTYKKPKDKQHSNIQNSLEVALAPTTVNVVSEVASSKPRSLSRPRYLSGLTKFSTVSKAASADELEKSTPRQTNLNATTSALTNGLSKGLGSANVALHRTQITAPSKKQSGGLKSPMGIKSKSFHNLSSNHTYNLVANTTSATSGVLLAPKGFGLKKPSATGTSIEKLAKKNQTRNSSLLNNSTSQQQITQQKPEESVFKVPNLISGKRAPGTATQTGVAAKRAGLVRPSSGYYSLSITTKPQPLTSDGDCDAGRHSPTDSMSSASSRGSSQGLIKNTVVNTTGASNISSTVKLNTTAPPLTKITTGSTGIPKPSGLRPPSNMKRSGLPRPSSFIKTEK